MDVSEAYRFSAADLSTAGMRRSARTSASAPDLSGMRKPHQASARPSAGARLASSARRSGSSSYASGYQDDGARRPRRSSYRSTSLQASGASAASATRSAFSSRGVSATSYRGASSMHGTASVASSRGASVASSRGSSATSYRAASFGSAHQGASGQRLGQPYLFGSAAPSLEREAAAARRPDLRIVPGQGRFSQVQELSSTLVFAAKIFVVVVVLAACLCVGRVALTSAALAKTIEVEQLSSQIETVRDEGTDLEIAQNVLSNPTYVKTQAAALGMAPAASTVQIVLDEDVVVTDEEGNLSLSGSLAAASRD